MSLITRRVRVPKIFLVLVPLLGLVFWYGLMPNILYSQAHGASRDGDLGRALTLYDRFLQWFPKDGRAPDALYWSALLLPGEGDFRAFFFPGLSSWSGSLGRGEEVPAEIPGRVERFERLLADYPHSWPSRWHVPYHLGEELVARGRTEDGIALLEEALRSEESRQDFRAVQTLYSYYADRGQYGEALRVINTYMENNPNSLLPEMLVLQGWAHLAMGNPDEAEAAFKEVLPAYQKQREEMERFDREYPPDHKGFPPDYDSMEREWEEQVEWGLEQAALAHDGQEGKAGGEIFGRILVQGEPLENVRVLAVPAHPNGGGMIPPREGTYLSTLSGEDGSFHFPSLAPGSYRLGIELDRSQAGQVEGTHLQIRGGKVVLEEGKTEEVEFFFGSTIRLQEPAGDEIVNYRVEFTVT